jgi:membrane-associated phospholipid phosphatase
MSVATPRSTASGSSLDLRLLRSLRTRGHSKPIESALIALARTGEQGAGWHAIALAGALADPSRRPVYVRASRVVAIATAVNYAVKLLVGRRRPELPDLPPLVHTISSRSYPSAHATTSFAGAAALARALPVAPLYALAVAMAFTRPYLGVHYPSDVVAGAMLGTAIEKLVP